MRRLHALGTLSVPYGVASSLSAQPWSSLGDTTRSAVIDIHVYYISKKHAHEGTAELRPDVEAVSGSNTIGWLDESLPKRSFVPAYCMVMDIKLSASEHFATNQKMRIRTT